MAITQQWLNIKILYGFLPYTLHSDMQFSHCLLICVTLVVDKGYAYADQRPGNIEARLCILFRSTYSSGTFCCVAQLKLIIDMCFSTLCLITYIMQLLDVDFIFQVVEHGLGHLPFTEKQVVTPTGVLTGCSIFSNCFNL